VGFLIVKVHLFSTQNPVKCLACLLRIWNVLALMSEVPRDFPSAFKTYYASTAE